jgi:CheY-like chemotaxis protein
VLVVEDDPAVGELLAAVLNDVPGWRAAVARDAVAAVGLFRQLVPDLLVMDVNLPGLSGPEVLELLHQDPHWRNQPVVLMSARPDQAAVLDALRRRRVVRFLAKPFDLDELIATIQEALADAADRRPAA